jgi:hypothetical protein
MPGKSSRKSRSGSRVKGILGVGLDTLDGQTRVTRTEEMMLVGGSQETHERMQETAIRFSEGLEKRGKTLPEVTLKEAIDLLREAREKGG